MRRAPVVALLGVCAGVSCREQFDHPSDLRSFHVLAVRAEPPSIAPGESAALSALAYAPAGESVSWVWEWCPFTRGPDEAYACALTREQLQDAVDRAAGPGAATIPPFDLGTDAAATMPYVGTGDVLRGLCGAIAARAGLPPGVEPPDCSQGMPITIRVTATDGGISWTAVKTLTLLYDASAPRNRNPALAGLFVRPEGGAETEIAPGAAASLARGSTAALRVAPAAGASEAFVSHDEGERAEDLLFSWFAEGGDLDHGHTLFVAGELPIERAVRNTFVAPGEGAIAPLRVIVVVRDGRGGTGWIERAIEVP